MIQMPANVESMLCMGCVMARAWKESRTRTMFQGSVEGSMIRLED